MSPPAPVITLLLAEDHTVVRQGLRALLQAEPGFTVVAEARTGREAVELARMLRPAVVLMDLAMPVLNGLEATRQILAENPAARVLILSAHSGDEYLEHFAELGAAGFLEKQTSAAVLVEAVLAVVRGERFLSPSIRRRQQMLRRARHERPGAKDPGRRLTARETEVLQLVAEGLANKQIAGSLGISIKTVEKHRQKVMDKLSIHETAGLTRYALAQGVVERGVRMTII